MVHLKQNGGAAVEAGDPASTAHVRSRNWCGDSGQAQRREPRGGCVVVVGGGGGGGGV